MKLSVEAVRARLRAPFRAAWETITERELLLVRLEDTEGNAGWGEAAPLRGYGGVGLPEVRAALAAFRPVLAARTHAGPEELLGACAAVSDIPDALAAIDLALWDLEGRRSGLPVWGLLRELAPWDMGSDVARGYPTHGDITRYVTVNATVAAEDPAEVSAAVATARTEGFSCVKVKVAVGDDVRRLAAARSAGGEEMAIRIDANGAWTVDQALAALEALAPFGIELCEEPVHGLEAVARVAPASPVAIALDETGLAPGALERRICDAACLKVALSGGISGLVRRASKARAAGYRVYLASALDGPLGIAAALHVAAVIGPELPCGLATLPLIADRPHPLPARGGRISVPLAPGLSEGLVEWYREPGG